MKGLAFILERTTFEGDVKMPFLSGACGVSCFVFMTLCDIEHKLPYAEGFVVEIGLASVAVAF